MKGYFVRGLISVSLLALLLSSSAHAQVQNSTGAAGLTVSPVIDEFTVNQGATVTRTVRVINPISTIVTLYPVVMNFTTGDQEGHPQFFTNKEKSSAYALSDWVTFDKPVIKIAPGEDEQFSVKISAPSTAEPGGHYGAILFSTEKPNPDTQNSNVSVVGLIGTLLLATVPGDITQKMTLEDFTAPNFLTKPPADFSLLFSNTGNIHLKPLGEIKIKNMFGNVVKTLPINDGRGNVLPGSKRHFDTKWDFDWKAVGVFNANAVVTFGAPEQQVSMVRTFIVIPIWLIITLAALILLLIAWIFYRRYRRGRRVQKVNSSPPPSSPPTPPTPISTPKSDEIEKKRYVMR